VGEVDFGESGTNSQHSFFQLLHLGQPVPCDFIGFVEAQNNLVHTEGEDLSCHDELMSNCKCASVCSIFISCSMLDSHFLSVMYVAILCKILFAFYLFLSNYTYNYEYMYVYFYSHVLSQFKVFAQVNGYFSFLFSC
jgi:hypothetical protein